MHYIVDCDESSDTRACTCTALCLQAVRCKPCVTKAVTVCAGDQVKKHPWGEDEVSIYYVMHCVIHYAMHNAMHHVE